MQPRSKIHELSIPVPADDATIRGRHANLSSVGGGSLLLPKTLLRPAGRVCQSCRASRCRTASEYRDGIAGLLISSIHQLCRRRAAGKRAINQRPRFSSRAIISGRRAALVAASSGVTVHVTPAKRYSGKPAGTMARMLAASRIRPRVSEPACEIGARIHQWIRYSSAFRFSARALSGDERAALVT